MKAKDYLKQLKKQNAIIENCYAELEKWNDVAFGVTAHLDGDRVQSSGSKQKMANAVESMVDIKAEIREGLAKAQEIRREIISTIEQLHENEYDVLYKMYVLGMSFKEVAASKGKSTSWATTVHGRALQSVQRILDEREKPFILADGHAILKAVNEVFKL